MRKISFIALFFSLLANANTAPVTNGLDLKYGSQSGLVNTSNGAPSVLNCGANTGYLPTWSGTVFSCAAPPSSSLTASSPLVYSSGNLSLIDGVNAGDGLVWDGGGWTVGQVVSDVSTGAPLTSTGGTNPEIDLPQSTDSTDGYLSSGDHQTFSAKIDSVGATAPITVDSSNPQIPLIACVTATNSVAGCLSATDHTTFAGKQDALGFTAVPNTRTVNGHALSANVTVTALDVGLGNVTNAAQVTSVGATAPIQSSGGTTPTISCITATDSVAGCLSAADHATFNGKQASGSYITALTGDATASGPGSAAITLATVNASPGSCVKPTVNGKGLATACSTLGSGDIPNNAANTSGNAATVTTNANLTGPITSTGNATSIASQTGTGTKFVMDTSPTIAGTLTQTGQYSNSFAGTASNPAMFFSGSPFSGGTTTTTRPAFLMEDAASPSSTWSTSGTYIGVNAVSTFSGQLLELDKAGTSEFSVSASGGGVFRGTVQAAQLTVGAVGIVSTSNNLPVIVGSTRTFSTTDQVQLATSTNNGSSGAHAAAAITPTYNQTSTAGGTDLLINRTETAVGSGAQLLIDAQVASTSKFSVDRTGTTTIKSLLVLPVQGSGSTPTGVTGAVAITNAHIMCTYTGSTWVKVSDGSTACTF